MSHALRQLCIGLCVAIMVALNLHGAVQAHHSVAHAAGWPSVAVADVDLKHGDAHSHSLPTYSPESDPDRDADREQPLGHHHHGTDAHAALPIWDKGLTEGLASVSAWRPVGEDHDLPGLPGDGPEYPPKRMRTVV